MDLSTRRIAIRRIKKNPRVFASMPRRLRGDPKIAKAAYYYDPSNLQYATSTLRGKRKFILSLIRLSWHWSNNPTILKYVTPCLLRDRDLVIAALKHNPGDIKYVDSLILRNDPDVMVHGIERDGFGIRYASPILKDSVPFALKVIRQYVDSYFLRFMTPRVRNDPQVVKAAIRNDGYEDWDPDRDIRQNPIYRSQVRAYDSYWKGMIYRILRGDFC